MGPGWFNTRRSNNKKTSWFGKNVNSFWFNHLSVFDYVNAESRKSAFFFFSLVRFNPCAFPCDRSEPAHKWNYISCQQELIIHSPVLFLDFSNVYKYDFYWSITFNGIANHSFSQSLTITIHQTRSFRKTSYINLFLGRILYSHINSTNTTI